MLILDFKGEHDYLWERKGLMFGVRKVFMTAEDGEGVMLISEPLNETESIQHQLLAERNSKELNMYLMTSVH